MERQEEKLIEEILGKEFLVAAKEYGAKMKLAVGAQGASPKIQEAMERLASVAFAKGGEHLKSVMWTELAKKYPKLNTWVLCKGESGRMFMAKVVKAGAGSLRFQDYDGGKTEKVTHWMVVPEIEEQVKEAKEVAMN